MHFTLDEKYPPKHKLTPREESFLQWLAEYVLFLDKSLFFQINDLQRHTKLVLSGRRIPPDKSLDLDEMIRSLSEIEVLMMAVEDELKRGESMQGDSLLIDILRSQHQALCDILDHPDNNKKSGEANGAYCNKDENSKVVLYVDAIEEAAKKDPYNTMLLMGCVMLHEYFHSFYFHAGIGDQTPIHCAEESMTEYGSLVLLDSVASSGSSIAKDACEALKYALKNDKRTQSRVGSNAAYGFGTYLFEKHRENYRRLIARYANASCCMVNGERYYLEFKYLLYPKYPDSPTIEDFVFEKLEELM